VIFRAHHLQEDLLFECYLAEQGGEPLAPPTAEHLTDCGDCSARYADLRRFMDALRTEANSELDEIFPAERQRAQQQQIARRIAQMGHHARVISFPGHRSGQPVAATTSTRVAARWISAAAAAGLFIGVGLGTVYYSQAPRQNAPTVASMSLAAPVAATEPAAAPARASEVSAVNDQFFSDLELALERPHTQELVALDELTPHVREVRVQLR
jgi:anti-sigma factor RsiW